MHPDWLCHRECRSLLCQATAKTISDAVQSHFMLSKIVLSLTMTSITTQSYIFLRQCEHRTFKKCTSMHISKPILMENIVKQYSFEEGVCWRLLKLHLLLILPKNLNSILMQISAESMTNDLHSLILNCQFKPWLDHLLCWLPHFLGFQTMNMHCTFYHWTWIHGYVFLSESYHPSHGPGCRNQEF